MLEENLGGGRAEVVTLVSRHPESPRGLAHCRGVLHAGFSSSELTLSQPGALRLLSARSHHAAKSAMYMSLMHLV